MLLCLGIPSGTEDINFQVLKFYPEVVYVFAGLEVALLAAGKPDGSLVNSVGTTVEEGWER
jgi:hypothetical protein